MDRSDSNANDLFSHVNELMDDILDQLFDSGNAIVVDGGTIFEVDYTKGQENS